MKSELRTLALALIGSLLLWNLPHGGFVLYPFKVIATWLHELSHGLMMILTGAQLDRVVIYKDTSGLSFADYAISPSGTAAIAAAGYMGTPFWGAVMLVAARTPKSARYVLIVWALLMFATVIFAIVPTPEEGRFGQYAIAAIASALVAIAFLAPPRWRLFAVHFLAAQACINALLDIRVLLRPTQTVGGVVSTSDATAMADAVFGEHQTWQVYLWSILWLAWSLLSLFIALRLRDRGREPSDVAV
ncbi:MAG: M50 family metallopeptidase [Kofleriaceae bacterium]